MDEENAYLCGYLKIKNLTDEYPEMVTFFDGEIISDKHPFLTRKWDADEDVDKKHWVGGDKRVWKEIIFKNNKHFIQGKFLAFCQYSKNFNSDSFNYEELKKTDYVFMRWKEHFLVPDHTIKVMNADTNVNIYDLFYSGYKRSELCWVLLHLLPEIHFEYRGILFSSKFGMVSESQSHPCSWLQYADIRIQIKNLKPERKHLKIS